MTEPLRVELRSGVLADELVERIARRVVELLDLPDNVRCRERQGLVDATTLAQEFGVSRDFVYEHRRELSGIELGDGTRPRLRFDVAKAREAWTRRELSDGSQQPDLPEATGAPRRRRQAAAQSTDGLLPVRPVEGRGAA